MTTLLVYITALVGSLGLGLLTIFTWVKQVEWNQLPYILLRNYSIGFYLFDDCYAVILR